MRILVWILILSAAWWGEIGCAKKLDPVEFVQRYVKLHRSHDIDGLLALHTDDTEFLMPGQPPIRGKEALRDLLEWDAVLESELTMSDISIDGDTILINTVIERNKFFQSMGVTDVRYQPGTRFVLRNERIVGTYPAAISEESLNKGRKEYQNLIQWLSTNRPNTLERLMPNGKFRYDAASARLWLKVLEEWKQSKQ